MPDFLYIPGDLRQQYLPFTIAGPGIKQVFSFKDRYSQGLPAFAQISTFSRWLSQLIENDSSFQYSHGPKGEAKVTLKEFLDEIPSLQIREFVPDAKLTQTFKWFTYFKKGFDAALKNVDGKSYSFADMKTAVKNVMDNIGPIMTRLTSGAADLLQSVVGGLASLYEDKGFNVGADNGYAVLFLPFILYYRLTTTNTNNVYELPYSMTSEIMKSDGRYGWTNSQSDFGLIDKAPSAIGNSAIGRMLLGNTVKVNTMPSFQPSGETSGETITITVDLINDTDEAAANNFLMCHTLFGNNRWLQYGFVQAGASLYDLKLPGANRYMMCTGQFSCKGKGAFRNPSENVLEKILNGCKSEKSRTFGDVVAENSDIRDSMVNEMVYRSLNEMRESNKSESVTESSSIRTPGFKDVVTVQVARRTESQVDTSFASSNTGVFSPLTTLTPKTEQKIVSREEIERFLKAEKDIPVKESAYADAEIRVQTAEISERTAYDAYIEADSEWKAAKDEYSAAKAAYDEDPTSENAERMERAEILANEAAERSNAATAAWNDASQNLSIAQTNLDTANTALINARIEYESAKEEVSAVTEKIRLAAESKVDSMISRKVSSPSDIKDLIKIPDVYSLTLTFQSLLPDNFNNYLYGFRAENLDPIENYAKGTVDETGVFEKLVQQLEAVLGG